VIRHHSDTISDVAITRLMTGMKAILLLGDYGDK